MSDKENLLKEVSSAVAERVEKDLTPKVTEAVTKEVVEKVREEVRDIIKDEMPVVTSTRKKDTREEERQKAVEYFKALRTGDRERMKALSEGDSGSGAELAPTYFSNKLQHFAEIVGLVRQNANRWPMTGKELRIPTMGNVSAYRVDEKGKITASDPSTGTVTLTAKKVAALIPVSNELLEDANVDVVRAIAKVAGEALAKVEDTWAFKGLQSGEGIFQTSGVNEVVSSATSIADVSFDDLLDLLSEIHASSAEGARWIMSWKAFNQLRKKAGSDGHYVYQAPGESNPVTIWNTRVLFSDVMPTAPASNEYALAIANFSDMYFGDRKQYTLDISKEATITDSDGTTVIDAFAQYMTVLRIVERVDIQLTNVDKSFGRLKLS